MPSRMLKRIWSGTILDAWFSLDVHPEWLKYMLQKSVDNPYYYNYKVWVTKESTGDEWIFIV